MVRGIALAFSYIVFEGIWSLSTDGIIAQLVLVHYCPNKKSFDVGLFLLSELGSSYCSLLLVLSQCCLTGNLKRSWA